MILNDFTPLSDSVIQQAEKAGHLANSLLEKHNFSCKKGSRSRSLKSLNKWSEKRELYIKSYMRANELHTRLKGFRNMGFETLRDFWKWQSKGHDKYRLEQKEKRKIEFENKHRYSPWFYSNSFGADYGTYSCDACKRNFHHSPSTITLAGKVVYNCACGNCTNSIIYRDWKEYPFN